ncbi:MAG: glutaredoxin family protein [Acidimicrobiales bacterium]|jgi:glutaredoxin
MSEITVFSTALCAPCELMKAWLTEHEYPFTVRDPMMDEEAGELLESHDIRTTPVMLVGERFVVGLDIAGMELALTGWNAN